MWLLLFLLRLVAIGAGGARGTVAAAHDALFLIARLFDDRADGDADDEKYARNDNDDLQRAHITPF